jgi:hypothetical protein
MSIRTEIVDLTRCARIQAELLGDPAFGAKVARLVDSTKGAS